MTPTTFSCPIRLLVESTFDKDSHYILTADPRNESYM
jgi:hypothetical protein